MRIITLVVAGAVGWFWLSSDEPADSKRGVPVSRGRHANLANLDMQVAVAQQAALTRDQRRPGLPVLIERDVVEIDPTPTIELDDDLLEEVLAIPPGQRGASLEAALGRALTIDDRLMLGIDEDEPEPSIEIDLDEPEPSIEIELAGDVGHEDEPEPSIEIDLARDVVGHEVIRIESHAPIIDRTSTSHCFTIDADYVVNVPVPGRTFESVLGASAGSQGEATFASGTTIENTYVVVE